MIACKNIKKKTHVHAMENKINHLCTDKMLCFKNGKHNSWKLCLCLHTKLSVRNKCTMKYHLSGRNINVNGHMFISCMALLI